MDLPLSMPNKDIFNHTFKATRYKSHTKYLNALREGFLTNFRNTPGNPFYRLFAEYLRSNPIDRDRENWRQLTMLGCFNWMIGGKGIQFADRHTAKSRKELVFLDMGSEDAPTIVAYLGYHAYRISTVNNRLVDPNKPKPIKKAKPHLIRVIEEGF